VRQVMIGMAALAALGSESPAFAQSGIPDLRGRWTVQYEAVGFRKPVTTASPTHYARMVEVTYLVDWQDGGRIAGREVNQKTSGTHAAVEGEPLVGVIGPDNATLLMVDENGSYDCRIRSAEILDCVYRHILPERSDIARGTWAKQK
jgi:hypothetical protein